MASLKFLRFESQLLLFLTIGLVVLLAKIICPWLFQSPRNALWIIVAVCWLLAVIALFHRLGLGLYYLAIGAALLPDTTVLPFPGAKIMLPAVLGVLLLQLSTTCCIEWQINRRLLYWSIGLFSLYIVSGAFSPEPWIALRESMPLRLPFVAGLVASGFIRNRIQLEKLAKVFVVCALVLTTLALIEYVRGQPLFDQSVIWLPGVGFRLQATYAFSSYLASYLVASIFWATPLMFSSKSSRVWRWLGWITTILGLFVVLQTHTGGVVLSLFIWCMLFVWFSLRQKSALAFGIALAVLLLSVCSLAAILLPSAYQNSIGYTFGYSTVESASALQRVYTVQAVINMLSKRPLLGFGGGMYYQLGYRYIPTDLPQELRYMAYMSLSSHSLFSDVLVETGILGGILLISLISTVVFLLVRRLKYTTDTSEKVWTASMLGLFLHVLTFAATHNYDTSPFFWICFFTTAVFCKRLPAE